MKPLMPSSSFVLSNISPNSSLRNGLKSDGFTGSKKMVHYKDEVKGNFVESAQTSSLILAKHIRSRTQLAPLLNNSDNMKSPVNGLGRFPSTEKSRTSSEKINFIEEKGLTTMRNDKMNYYEMGENNEHGVFDPKVSVDALDKWLNRMKINKCMPKNYYEQFKLSNNFRFLKQAHRKRRALRRRRRIKLFITMTL